MTLLLIHLVGISFQQYWTHQYNNLLYRLNKPMHLAQCCPLWLVYYCLLGSDQIQVWLLWYYMKDMIWILIMLQHSFEQYRCIHNVYKDIFLNTSFNTSTIIKLIIPLREHCTPAFSCGVTLLDELQLWWGEHSSKLLSDPLHPTSSKKKWKYISSKLASIFSNCFSTCI